MKTAFLSQAWEDYLYWQANDRQMLKKLNLLIKECQRTPFTGNGQPEPLKHELAGWWSRRIDKEHRLIYRVLDDDIEVAQCRYHY